MYSLPVEGSQTGWPRAARGRTRRVAIDIGLFIVVAAAICIAITAASEPNTKNPDALAYGLGIMMAALLFGRRRWPVAILPATIGILMVYYWLNYPGFVPAVPLAVPLYSAAAAKGLALPSAVAALWVVFPLLYRLFVDPEPAATVIDDVLRDAAFFAVIVLLGVAVRSRRAHAAEVAERLRRAEEESKRVAQELQVARLVQQQFLPAELRDLPGWRIGAFYRSAREVGGDFYTFIELPAGEVGIAIGDVTDKGAPAALVMATTQGLIHAEAARINSPSTLLQKVNGVLVPNTPDRMLVTCLYLKLDPESGHVQFANAGHPVPYLTTDDGVGDLRATGMPLGLLDGSSYELKEAHLGPGARLLLHSDGLAEAHNHDRDMFGLPRIVKVMEGSSRSDDLIETLLAELDAFTGSGWEQEDDITLVTLERISA